MRCCLLFPAPPHDTTVYTTILAPPGPFGCCLLNAFNPAEKSVRPETRGRPRYPWATPKYRRGFDTSMKD